MATPSEPGARPPSGPDLGAPRPDERLGAWTAFLRAHAVVLTRLERELAQRHDLPLTWYEVLLQLEQADGPVRMQELARWVLRSKSGLTRVIDRMEQAGLVERRTCDADRRGVFVAPTRKGLARFRAAAPTHLRGVATHFTSHLDGPELRTIRAALERVADAAERADQEPRPAPPSARTRDRA